MLRRQERHNEGTLTALMSTESLVQQDGCDNHTHEGKPARAYNITQCRRHCLLALVDLSASLDEFNDSTEIVLVSDFNLPDIDWSTNSFFRDTDLNCRLMNILLDHFMSQQVLEPPRGKNILDLVITTNEGLIRNLQVGEPVSDHNSIAFKVTMSSSKNMSHKKVYEFTKANLDRLNCLILVRGPVLS